MRPAALPVSRVGGSPTASAVLHRRAALLLLGVAPWIRGRRRALPDGECQRSLLTHLRLGTLTLLAACAGCCKSASETGAPWFAEEAHARGLDFSWQSGHAQKHYFPEIMGGGVALLDAEQDGDLDVYLVQAGSSVAAPAERPPNQLFENTGGGRFRDASAGSGAEDRGYGMGVAAGDANDDGRTDLYVTNVGPNALLLNQGACTFRDDTERAGVGDPAWSTSAAFVDYDKDGDLDLYVANYIRWSLADEITCYTKPHPEDYCSPNSYAAPAQDTLYRNEGDGRFSDVSFAAGLRAAYGNGLGVVCADFDGDGWSDVFVANDGMLNQLWHNRHDGTFEDLGVSSGCAVDQDGRKKAGMGTHAADVDFDGDEDLLVVNLAGESDSFYRNDGGRFSDRTPLVGLGAASRPFTRFGAGFADFDNDGFLDLYEANGRVTRLPEDSGPRPFDEPNLLFRGTRAGKFEEVHPRGGTREPLSATSRGTAFGDLDGDGGVDVVVVNRDSPAYFLMNRVPERGHWIAFQVRETNGRDALGAVLALDLDGTNVRRTVRSAYSYCAASDPRVHLGLGARTSIDGGVSVTWADGSEERFTGPFAASQVHVLGRGQSVKR
ncbi:MAG: CRTAC1 family protein [Planctomycetes bacterium]|nr:CRTAC1 family protein [Planctomycetota bacterium]